MGGLQRQNKVIAIISVIHVHVQSISFDDHYLSTLSLCGMGR